MTQVVAQELTVTISTTKIRVEIAPAVSVTQAQQLGRAVGGLSQTVEINSA